MNLVMCAEVTFPAREGRAELTVRKINACQVMKDISEICQKASITLPRKLSQFRNEQIKSFIRRNDPVVLRLGYDGQLREEFRGFVATVGSGIPTVLELRDELFPIMQRPYSKSWANCFLPDLVRELIPQPWRVDALEVSLGPQLFRNVTVGQALAYLKNEFSLYTFLKGDTVHVGRRFEAQPTTVKYGLELNVQEDGLKYKDGDEIRMKIEATSVLKDGKRIKVTVGDEDGEVRKLAYFGITSEPELKRIAENDLEKYKYDGYEGSITTYGDPYIDYADYAAISSEQFPERDATCIVEKVVVTFDDTPQYSRKLEIGGVV